MIVPHLLQQHGARHHLAGVPHEKLKQAELARLKIDLLSVAMHRPPQQIHFEPANRELGGRNVACRPTSESFDARNQFARRVGLGEIVIAPRLQPFNPMIDFTQR